jgi:hypothetical protein
MALTARSTVRFSKNAEERIKQKIAEKAGAIIRRTVLALHQRILDATAYNTGRTLGSWYGSADRPVSIDIADRFGGSDAFAWHSGLLPTNHLEVGGESGRSFYERISLSTTQSIDFSKNPFRKYFITNGAKLDSGNIIDSGGTSLIGISSDLPQGAGSRAWAQEYGNIASYDLFASAGGTKIHSFHPRGTNAVGLAIESIRRDFGRNVSKGK